MRERLEEHRKNPVCASCHARMDPLGFALENFDAHRPVAHDERRRADRRVGRRCPTAAGSRASPDCGRCCWTIASDFVRTFTEKLLTYALGRGVEYSDWPAVRQIVRDAAPGDYRWSSIILGSSRARRSR